MSEVVNVNPSQALDGIIGKQPEGPTEERINQKALGQADFFKLLTTQLASQDPLKPMEDTAFIAQMAQFSSLQMTSDLNDNFKNFTESERFQSAQNMIGKQVTLMADGVEISGIAQGIETVDGESRIFIDGKGYNVDGVFKVEAPPATESMTPAEITELVKSLVGGSKQDDGSSAPGEGEATSPEGESQGAVSTAKQVEANI